MQWNVNKLIGISKKRLNYVSPKQRWRKSTFYWQKKKQAALAPKRRVIRGAAERASSLAFCGVRVCLTRSWCPGCIQESEKSFLRHVPLDLRRFGKPSSALFPRWATRKTRPPTICRTRAKAAPIAPCRRPAARGRRCCRRRSAARLGPTCAGGRLHLSTRSAHRAP